MSHLDELDEYEAELELRLKKESMDPAQYEQQLEKLLTDLAVKTREIRERQTRKKYCTGGNGRMLAC